MEQKNTKIQTQAKPVSGGNSQMSGYLRQGSAVPTGVGRAGGGGVLSSLWVLKRSSIFFWALLPQVITKMKIHQPVLLRSVPFTVCMLPQ